MNWLGERDIVVDRAIEQGKLREMTPMHAEAALSGADVKPFFHLRCGGVEPVNGVSRWTPKGEETEIAVLLEDFVEAFHFLELPPAQTARAMYVPTRIHVRLQQQAIMAAASSALGFVGQVGKRPALMFLDLPVRTQAEDTPL